MYDTSDGYHSEKTLMMIILFIAEKMINNAAAN
jgi:hypothetical protein